MSTLPFTYSAVCVSEIYGDDACTRKKRRVSEMKLEIAGNFCPFASHSFPGDIKRRFCGCFREIIAVMFAILLRQVSTSTASPIHLLITRKISIESSQQSTLSALPLWESHEVHLICSASFPSHPLALTWHVFVKWIFKEISLIHSPTRTHAQRLSFFRSFCCSWVDKRYMNTRGYIHQHHKRLKIV